MNKLFKFGCAAVVMLASCVFARAAEKENEIALVRLSGPEMNLVVSEIANPTYLALSRDHMISNFIINNAKKFRPADFSQISDVLSSLSDRELEVVSYADYRDPTLMLVLAVTVGGLGVDRFLLDDVGLGVLKLITGGGLGIWWLVDIFTVDGRTKDYNFRVFNEVLQNAQLALPRN